VRLPLGRGPGALLGLGEAPPALDGQLEPIRFFYCAKVSPVLRPPASGRRVYGRISRTPYRFRPVKATAHDWWWGQAHQWSSLFVFAAG